MSKKYNLYKKRSELDQKKTIKKEEEIKLRLRLRLGIFQHQNLKALSL